jgi:hypothetical protein
VSTPNPTTYKINYTVQYLAGLAFLAAIGFLIYWLIFEYEVRSILGLGLILVFLCLPLLHALFSLPAGFFALILIWQSDDPAATEKQLIEIRERMGV